MKRNLIKLSIIILFISCENSNPAYRFSNFENTPAERIAKAIKRNDIKLIKEEITSKNIDVDYKEVKNELSLLELAIANHKKEAFKELLLLGANTNIDDSYCGSPLKTAIATVKDCDLYFIDKLLEYNANITPEFFKKCGYFDYDPILETILYYNDSDNRKCGIDILKVLTKKLGEVDLNDYNNSEEYEANIVYFCLSTLNLDALKFFIIDLKCDIPNKIYIDETVLMGFRGYKPLKEIMYKIEYNFVGEEYNNRAEKVKMEIIEYLNREKN